MRIWLNKNFGFSRGEFNGLLFLVSIILILKAIPLLYSAYKPIEKDDPNLLSRIQNITLADEKYASEIRDRIENPVREDKSTLFKFDPNTLDATGWQRLGLSPKQAQAIVNYTQKGGRFYKAEDLTKMYTISQKMYGKLLPYVNIANQQGDFSKKFTPFEKKEYVKKAAVIVDINLADSAKLDEIKGIGGAFASRIVKYRNRLGGFYKKEQLMEVYGLDANKYAAIESQVSMSAIPLKQVNINTATFNDLKANPYLSYKQINAILQYRKQHGNYAGSTDLKKIAILNQEVIDKILPYISF